MADVRPVVIGLDAEDRAAGLPVVAALEAGDEAVRAPSRLIRQKGTIEGPKTVEVSKSMLAVAPADIAADIEPTELRTRRRKRKSV